MEVEDIILTPEAVLRAVSMIREKEILDRHKHRIYQGKDFHVRRTIITTGIEGSFGV